MENLQQLLPLPQAAQYLGVKVKTLRRYISEGRIPVIPLSERSRRIRAGELENFVQRCMNGGASPESEVRFSNG